MMAASLLGRGRAYQARIGGTSRPVTIAESIVR
jgi:hypothetical protein